MFHIILTLSYVIPGVYIFFRIWQLFITREWRLCYILIFTLLFIVYPLSNLVGENNGSLFAQILIRISNYLLPFFLYVFLFVVLIDLLLLFNLMVKIMPREKIRERSLMTRVFMLIITISVTVVIAGIINFNTIRTTEFHVNVKKRSSEIDGLKIAFVSDFHLQEGTPVWFVESFLRKINDINPDLILFGGDIIEGDREDENMIRIGKLLSSISARYGVFGVLGNHEHYARQDKGNFFNRSGIKILSDSVIIADNSFILAGRNDSHIQERKSIEELLRSIPDSLPVILVDHRPTEIEQVSMTNTDIQLSGHTHDGQLFPINLITNKIYTLSRGYRKFGNTHFFVSSGIRLWGPPVRTIGKSEIIILNVSFL